MKPSASSARQQAVWVISQVLQQGKSLTTLLPAAAQKLSLTERTLLKALCFETMRWYYQLHSLLDQLLDQPVKPAQQDIYSLLLLASYQLLHSATPDYAVINESVKLAKQLDKPWAAGFVNGVLRNLQRQQSALLTHIQNKPEQYYAHPLWLVKMIRQAWPTDWQQILANNNQHPPMTLRVNQGLITTTDYQNLLANQGISAKKGQLAESSLYLDQPCPVDNLPNFAQGYVSVQDEAAQLAVDLLDLQPGQRLLDACAAPGGKTCHIIERQNQLTELIALDIDTDRLTKVQQNLNRVCTGNSALAAALERTQLKPANAMAIKDWWDGQLFDRILLDAPCSGTGVIRRHPDIKYLRKATDIPQLVNNQQQLLAALWPTLKIGGKLVYATCSILPMENQQLITSFCRQTPNVQLQPINKAWGLTTPVGCQLLPQSNGGDGFFYACLVKS
jgi:16S rRNA (cytosine967-C5)-methyltransferase